MDLKLQKPLYLKDIEREESDISPSVAESYLYRFTVFFERYNRILAIPN